MELEITTDKSKIDVPFVHQYLSKTSYWAKGRTYRAVKESIENSLCFSALLNEVQIGFARVVTDKGTFAYIADLFIDEKYQRNGYGRRLMETIMAHPDLQSVERWMLLTKDAHKLYKKYGFRKTKKAKWVMEYLPGI